MQAVKDGALDAFFWSGGVPTDAPVVVHRLVAVASPSEAVLDYYELEGRRTDAGGWCRPPPPWTPCPGRDGGRPPHP